MLTKKAKQHAVPLRPLFDSPMMMMMMMMMMMTMMMMMMMMTIMVMVMMMMMMIMTMMNFRAYSGIYEFREREDEQRLRNASHADFSLSAPSD